MCARGEERYLSDRFNRSLSVTTVRERLDVAGQSKFHVTCQSNLNRPLFHKLEHINLPGYIECSY